MRKRYYGRDVHSETTETIAVGFIDLYEAYHTVPRETMAKVRWMGIQEEEVKMAEGTYEETKGRIVSGTGISEDIRVEVGLKQGSALSPLLFIAVVELIWRTARARDILRQMINADDQAVVADSEAVLQGRCNKIEQDYHPRQRPRWGQ